METFKRRYNGRVETFRVLTVAEAEGEGLRVRPLSEAGAGDWVKTDDGYVVQCLKVNRYVDRKKRNRTLFTLSCARVWDRRNVKLRWEERRASGNFVDCGTSPWQEREARRLRTKNAVRVYVQQVLSGKLDWHAVGMVYRPDQRTPAATVRRLFKQEIIQDMVTDEFKAQMEKKGLNADFVMDKLTRAAELAEEKQDGATLLKVSDRVAEYLGIAPEKRKITASFELGGGLPQNYDRQIDAAEEETALPAPKTLANDVVVDDATFTDDCREA